MKIKKSYNVFGQPIKMNLKKGPLTDEYGRQLAGFFDPQKNTILVDNSLPEDQLIKTIIHELGHALLFRLGLPQTSLPHDLHELIVEGYSNFIYEEFVEKKKVAGKKLK